MLREHPYDRHVSLVTAVAAVVEPPPEWTELQRRFADYLDRRVDTAAQLAAAVMAGDPDAIAALQPLAIAEATGRARPEIAATVTNTVRAAVTDRLHAIYETRAVEVYGTIAAKFNSSAEKFTATTELADPNADPESVVAAPAKVRTAWSDAPLLAAELDELLPALHAAAELCGVPTPTPPDGLLLPLCVDTTGHHRRRLWEAWRNRGRAGRWSALTTLGATIRAHPHPADIEPYRPPRPMETRTATRDGETRVYQVDPEDADYQPPPEPLVYGRASFVG